MSEGMNGKVWTIILTGVLALAGTIVGGWLEAESKIELERTKLDSSVISLALAQKTEKERQEFLEFLVATNLIKDQETKEGLKKYFGGPNAKSPPFIAPEPNEHLTERTLDNAKNTDIDFFICEKDMRNEPLIQLLMKSHRVVSALGEFGESKYKPWGKKLNDEIAVAELRGKTTVVMDFDHPEYAERETINRRLQSVHDQLPIVFMDNRGNTTPWRLSIIFCAE